jgi:hypothetical protein
LQLGRLEENFTAEDRMRTMNLANVLL